MDKRHDQAIAMREQGLTYKEIGSKLGVSRQRAHQIVHHEPGNYVHNAVISAIPYKGLREWMQTNRVSPKKLGELCGQDVNRAVKGRGCTKRAIDAILRVTGLEYEKCFEVG